MPVRRFILIFAAMSLVSGCSTPEVNRNASGFDLRTFESDLNNCRGGGAVEAAVTGLKGAVVGSALGAAEGASSGALSGGSAEGAIVGTILGAIVGLGVGAYDSVSEQETNLANCLRDKGYDVMEPKETATS